MGLTNLSIALETIIHEKIKISPAIALEQPGEIWLLFDPYQSINDIHRIEKNSKNKVFWVGNLLDSKLINKGLEQGSVKQLGSCFRLPVSVIDHIEENHILPTPTLPQPLAVQGLGVTRETILLPAADLFLRCFHFFRFQFCYLQPSSSREPDRPRRKALI